MQTDCFAELVLSVTMIFRVTVGFGEVDDEKNQGSSQSCAGSLHSPSPKLARKLDLSPSLIPE